MSNSLSRLVTLLLFLALAVPTTVLAQTADTAELSGVVLDASGKPAKGYPLKLSTAQWGNVIIRPTEDDGTLSVTGLPAGSYEVRVFEPGGNMDQPIASKKFTLTAGQKEKLEIRLGSDKSGGAAAGSLAAGSTLASIGVDWTKIAIVGGLLAAGLVVFFIVRSQRSAGVS